VRLSGGATRFLVPRLRDPRSPAIQVARLYLRPMRYRLAGYRVTKRRHRLADLIGCRGYQLWGLYRVPR
jgi:hypothetical protein